ncbi:LacI family DNA-binding transcriptional regulator [Tessaracoccus caeni]|uniref:LacI family DNA-binding transcriptional regulator n=1 Tax=Tessaracoccus caeni TaxID=3031239 RepID=UPI0023DAB04D|nr:LacI family DNA-binding transcriptional regulator [Tessaracoccus caeni]MDF1488074.1 LacI family DNA-binding transcriptional regulator [Tessaracoccus caeni]
MTDGEAAGTRAGRAPTIRDVAERAGVSKSLVSSVLQGKGRVSDASRALILQTIEELGYRPNSRARALSKKRSDTIGIVLNDLSNPWFIDLLAGLSATLHSSGLSPLLTDRATDDRIGVSSVEKLLAQDVDGLVLVGTMAHDQAVVRAATKLPVVLAGTRDPDVGAADVVVNDDVAGTRSATEHLLSLGHTRIGHLSGAGEIGGHGKIGALRREGFRSAMIDAGLDPDVYIELGCTSEESGFAAARRLLTRSDRPTAILAFNDMAAIGAMSAADDLGLRIPEDVSLVGYDNTYIARIRHLSLTSIDNGSFAVGAQAGRFLIERLATPSLPARIHLVTPRLEVRGSTSAPRTS